MEAPLQGAVHLVPEVLVVVKDTGDAEVKPHMAPVAAVLVGVLERSQEVGQSIGGRGADHNYPKSRM